MTEKPILFSAPMVNAILGGRKTMTRRVIFKDDPDDHCPWRTGNGWQDGDLSLVCPYVIGDTLWVRETFAVNCVGGQDFLFYRADSYPDGDGAKWKPSIFMSRKHSRITLRITDVRAERLQEIDEGDAIAEGVEQYQRSYGTAYLDYRGEPGAFFINKTRRNSPCFSYGDISRQAVLGLDVDPSQNKFSFLNKVCYSHSYA